MSKCGRNFGKPDTLKGRMVVTDASLKIPPMIDTPIDSGYSETRIFHTKLPLIIQSDIPMQFLAFRFDYVDRATGRELSQRFYYKWEGSKRGFFHNEFFGLSTTDTDKFVAYLRTQLGRWDL